MESKVIINYTNGEREILDIEEPLESFGYDMTRNVCLLPIHLSNGKVKVININNVNSIEYEEEEVVFDDED